MNIFEDTRAKRDEYENGSVNINDRYSYSQYKKINKEILYYAGIHETPFFDPVFNGAPPFDNSKIKKAVVLEYLKTDFDTKDSMVTPDKPDRESRVSTMFATYGLYEWYKENNFKEVLNEITWNRAKHGGALVKKLDKGVAVVPWRNVITDHADILSGTIIEKHYFTPDALKDMEDVWHNVDDAISLARDEVRSDKTKNSERNTNLIEVYEVHGVFPESLLYEDGEDNKYKRMMFILAGIDNYTEESKDEEHMEHGVILYQKEEKELPYKLLIRNAAEKEAGRSLGPSVVEDLFESTKWKNLTLAEEMRLMSAAKIFWETDDPKIPSNLTAYGHNTVIKRTTGKTFNQVSVAPTAIAQYGNTRRDWETAERDITGMYEANSGERGTANTPFRAQALQALEGNARFEQYREEIGFFLEELIKDWILPEALTEMRKKDYIYTEFSDTDLKLIDEAITQKHMVNYVVENTLKGVVVTPEMQEAELQKLNSSLKSNKRMIEGVKEFIKNIPRKVKVSFTNEHKNKDFFAETRVNLLQFYPENDPRREAILDRIADEFGVTQDELELKREAMGSQQGNAKFTAEEKSNVEKVV